MFLKLGIRVLRQEISALGPAGSRGPGQQSRNVRTFICTVYGGYFYVFVFFRCSPNTFFDVRAVPSRPGGVFWILRDVRSARQSKHHDGVYGQEQGQCPQQQVVVQREGRWRLWKSECETRGCKYLFIFENTRGWCITISVGFYSSMLCWKARLTCHLLSFSVGVTCMVCWEVCQNQRKTWRWWTFVHGWNVCVCER